MNQKTIAGILLAILLLIVISYFVQSNIQLVSDNLDQGILSMVMFSVSMFLITLFPPISAIPLFPVATGIWGVWLTVILSLIGKVLGAMVAFMLARKYGTKIVQNFVSLKKIYRHQKSMPKENVFLSILFFRIALPLDVFNYLFGLLKSVKASYFFAATLISFALYTFTVSYFGSLQWEMQIIILVFGLLIGFSIWAFSRKKRKTSKR